MRNGSVAAAAASREARLMTADQWRSRRADKSPLITDNLILLRNRSQRIFGNHALAWQPRRHQSHLAKSPVKGMSGVFRCFIVRMLSLRRCINIDNARLKLRLAAASTNAAIIIEK